MQAVIDFVMGHLYLVIVVIGLIYTMFFRKSPLEKPPQNRPPNRPANRMPDFGGSPVFPVPRQPRQTAAPPADRIPEGSAGQPMPPVERREPQPEYARPVPSSERTPRPAWAESAEERTPRPAWAEPSEEGSSRPAWASPTLPSAPGPAWASHPYDRSAEPGSENPYRSGTGIQPHAEPETVQVTAPVRPVSSARATPVPATAVPSAEETHGALTRDDLTRAIVWTEILGPPRARKPFRR
ncbi:hypothetical protein [Cohnella caldifontis]|uniref:hypothetical protein n=1 Tax=Cohnella caldifontis TaxID=3027471 RepID=UPI0023EB95F5|nr:hypothetical protein [Cohnella sp. YIM B05605]